MSRGFFRQTVLKRAYFGVEQQTTISVYLPGTTTYAALFVGETGPTPVANPILPGHDGEIEFWVESGKYDIEFVAGTTVTLHSVPIFDYAIINGIVNGDLTNYLRSDIDQTYTGSTLTIAGDLVVQGATTTVDSENLTVKDNIITLNEGETGAGVSLVYAGIEVDRGTLATASLVFNEATDYWQTSRDGGVTSYRVLTSEDIGAGNDLDADLLDGQHGSFYQNAGNLNAGFVPGARFNDASHGSRSGGSLHAVATTGVDGFMSAGDKSKLNSIEVGATADQTAAEILAALITVDGSGSGLDADLLDGVHRNDINEQNDFIGFTVDGDANTYYPVLLAVNTGGYFWKRTHIHRGYSEQAPDTWYTASHKGGLTFTFEHTSDSAWGGNDQNIRVLEFHESYSNMVAGLALSTDGMVVWLRGGGAFYRLHDVAGKNANVTVYLSGFTAANSSVYNPRTDLSSVQVEIVNRWPVRYGGTVFSDGNPVWTSGNDGAGSGLDADTVDGYHASTSPNAYSIVVRNSAGYITTPYMSMSASNSPPKPARMPVSAASGSDDYLYWQNWGDFIGHLNTSNIQAGNAGTLDGYTQTATAGVANTIVRRDANGYIHTNYLNMTADVNNNTPGRVIIERDNDGFLRKQDWTAFNQLIRNNTGGTWYQQEQFTSSGQIHSGNSNLASLHIRSDTPNDAFVSFHIGGDYAVHFGLDGATNDLAVGGWSMGEGNSYRIWHAGNDGSGSGLDADTLDGAHHHQISAGQRFSHAQHTDFNTFLGTDYFGIHHVVGTNPLNGPPSQTGDFYHQRWALGSEYNNYSMQIAIQRNTANPYLNVRFEEIGVGGAWTKIRAGQADNADTLDGLDSTQFLRSDTDDNMSGNLIFQNYGIGVVGTYSATRYQNVFSMGAGYVPSADGLSLGNMYGIAYTHANIGGQSHTSLSHQTLFVEAGLTKTAIGTGVWTVGSIWEQGQLLSARYLGIGAKAADSNLLDGIDSTGFVQTAGNNTLSGKLTLTSASVGYNNLALSLTAGDLGVSRGDGTGVVYFGGGDNYLYWNGTNFTLNPGQLYIQGAPVAQAAQTGWQDESNYPLGYTIVVGTGAGVYYARNSSHACYTSTQNWYFIGSGWPYGGAQTQLAGTWRSRGYVAKDGDSSWWYLMERVA